MDDGQPSFRVMEVVGVTVELPDQYPVVTLCESESPLRELTFRVGMAEGVALSQALRKLKSPRPLTHELLTTVLGRLGADVVAVRLTGRQGTVYLAELDLMSARGARSCRAGPATASPSPCANWCPPRCWPTSGCSPATATSCPAPGRGDRSGG